MKRHAPATARNSEPIAEVLARELPAEGLVLEIASGSGEHAVFMARRFPQIDWQPSDPDGEALASIGEWAREAGFTNLRQPVELDTRAADWPLDAAKAVVCINMVHISPWAATEALFAGSARLLAPGFPLILYGPYFEDDVEPASSNVDFDRSLRERNAEWGIRNVSQLEALADRSGFEKTARYEMPANNLTLVFRRR